MYDGVFLGSVERASKHKASSSPSDSGAARRRSPGRNRGKTTKAADVLELPLRDTSRPLTRGKAKLLARCCDLNEALVFADASPLPNRVRLLPPLSPMDQPMDSCPVGDVSAQLLYCYSLPVACVCCGLNLHFPSSLHVVASHIDVWPLEALYLHCTACFPLHCFANRVMYHVSSHEHLCYQAIDMCFTLCSLECLPSCLPLFL